MSNNVIKKWVGAGPTLRSAAAAVATAAMLLVGCAAEDSPTEAVTPDVPPSSSATSEAVDEPASTGATMEAPAGSPLEGAWQAGPISLKETEATIRRHGLGRYVDDYRANAPFFGDTLLILTIENGAWDLYGESGGSQPAPIDYDADYKIDDDTVVFHHSDGSNTYRWQVDHDTLSLHFVGSTMPGYRGVPDEVFQRALYMTEVFKRRG